MGFSQALSGLNSSATNLDVIGNNISNAQTAGFKSSKALFSDVYANAQVGLGTKVSAVLQDFSTGTLESSGRDLDLAIDGEGFFRMVQNDEVVYSRNGQLTLDQQGYMVNAQGARLTGFPASAQQGGNPEELQIPAGSLQAKSSTSVGATLNLDARVDEIDRGTTAFDASDATTYSYANNVTLFDSQGNSHNATMYFTKDSATNNRWELRMEVPDNTVTPATTLQAGPVNVDFDTNGVIDPATAAHNFTFTMGSGEVEPIDIEFDLGEDTTQFGNDFSLDSLNQDGYASGSLLGVTINEQGKIIGNYSNEQSQELGTIALANFNNVEGLQPAGDNAWRETTKSGQALLGQANSGQFGSIQSGVVENSNVDLTRELVDMIIAQRNYQANAQTIKVQDEVLQNAVNMR